MKITIDVDDSLEQDYITIHCKELTDDILELQKSLVDKSSSYLIYTNALFYFLLLVYFLISKDLNLKEWFRSFKSGRKYWIQVLLTLFGFMLAFSLTILLEGFFPNFEIGSISLT